MVQMSHVGMSDHGNNHCFVFFLIIDVVVALSHDNAGPPEAW